MFLETPFITYYGPDLIVSAFPLTGKSSRPRPQA
jgi:hypothetical protein